MQYEKSRGRAPAGRDQERGAIAVLMSLCLTILLGFAAMGFDLSYVRLGRLQMENATDAAAHAAMVVLRVTGDIDAAADAAEAIAHKHEVLGQPMKLTDADVIFGTYNFQAKTFTANSQPYNSVRVNSQRFSSDTGGGLINLTFGRALGYTEADVTQTVTGAFVNRYFQLEVDITDSYICNVNAAADATVSFLKYLAPKSWPGGLGNGTPGDWIALDVFSGVPTSVTVMKNVSWKFPEILDDPSALHGSWLRDADTRVGTQNKGIGVCSKSDGAPTKCYNGAAFVGTAVPGGYRQCPPNALPPPPYAACTNTLGTQFEYPNHSWMPLCSGGKPSVTALNLWAGTDLAEAIRVGRTKLLAAAQPDEPKVLILFTDGSPMVCTGPGGGGLCGDTNDSTGLKWQPCCAGGLSCGPAWTDSQGNGWGASGWGDGNPDAGESGIITAPATATGGTACTKAKAMVNEAISEANLADTAKIDLFVIGLMDPTGKGAEFAESLHRRRGTTTVFTDPAQIAGAFQAIPAQVPLSLVR